MQQLHKEIFTKEQIDLLPVIGSFSENFGLVGGTAIALHIGHRESIDFDMFSYKKFGNLQIRNIITKQIKIDNVIVDKLGEFTILIKGVKITFFHYPFDIKFNTNFGYSIKIPDLLTLGAMKAYALGRRPKWKDYVDLYFIMKDFYKIGEISKKAGNIFGKEFSERMFRNQLAYFDDMDYKERVIWKSGFELPEEEIKKSLIEFSLEQ
jgi:hypothetical protein